jgi:hypothetical protein
VHASTDSRRHPAIRSPLKGTDRHLPFVAVKKRPNCTARPSFVLCTTLDADASRMSRILRGSLSAASHASSIGPSGSPSLRATASSNARSNSVSRPFAAWAAKTTLSPEGLCNRASWREAFEASSSVSRNRLGRSTSNSSSDPSVTSWRRIDSRSSAKGLELSTASMSAASIQVDDPP